MRLFLSSQDLGRYPEVFLKMLGQSKKVGLIENAKDDWAEAERAANVRQHMESFSELSFEPVEIDLRKFFGKAEDLKKLVDKLDGVFIHGGNTFILRRALAASGLDKILQAEVSANRLAYGGSSAGSCVAAPSLHGIDRGDSPSPDAVPKNYPIKETIWEGLNFVPFMIVPHYTSDWFRKDALATEEKLKKLKMPYKVLEDGQVYVIDGDRGELLT